MHLRLCALALMLLPLAAAAQVYRWVDESGRVHYTQTPPKTGKYDIMGPATPPSAAPNQDSLQKSLQEGQKGAAEQQKQAEKVAQEQAARQQRCSQAMERLAYLEANTARRLASKDEKGEPVRLTDEEYDKRVAEAQQAIKENCG